MQSTSAGGTDLTNKVTEAMNKMVYDPSLDANSQGIKMGRRAVAWDTQASAPLEGRSQDLGRRLVLYLFKFVHSFKNH